LNVTGQDVEVDLVYYGTLKTWNGAWQNKPLKVWDGSQFSVKPVRRFDGASWKRVRS
jgi:hypothetical protein